MPKTKSYERRLILFVDFLGFKEIVDRTATDPEALRKLLWAMQQLRAIGDDAMSKSQRFQQFSDCVVLSFKVKEPSGVFYLLNDIGLATITLASAGFLLRGAVTVGDLYHDDDFLVGPAMVRAYELESRTAKFPRIIIDPDALEVGRSNRSNRHTRREESAYLESFLLKDEDGWLFFDWFSWKVVIEAIGGADQAYPNYLARLAATLKTGLAHPVPSCAEKYLWVRRHYLRALDMMATANPEHRRLNPEFWEVIDSLPRLNKAAAKAEARVASAKTEDAGAGAGAG